MAVSESEAKTKRRWLRFSLRTFLIVVVLLCVLLVWFAYQVERQRKAVEWVKENGGLVVYDYQATREFYVIDKDARPPVPKWLCDWVGVDFFAYVERVSILDQQLGDLKPLARLTRLNLLYLNGNQISDLSPIAGMKNLEHLNLSQNPLEDLSPLQGLTNLIYLDLDQTSVSDLSPLADLKKLQVLLVHDTKVDEFEIEELQNKLPNCTIQHDLDNVRSDQYP